MINEFFVPNFEVVLSMFSAAFSRRDLNDSQWSIPDEIKQGRFG